MNNSNWNESILISIGLTINATWKNNFTEYVSVSKVDNPSGTEGKGLCNGCGISVNVIYLEQVTMTVLFQLEVCILTCITAAIAWMPVFQKEKEEFTLQIELLFY